jgi:hypothetical protein
VFRKIITYGDYIARSTRVEQPERVGARAVLEHARQIPTARDFFENALRGYHDARVGAEQARSGTA